MAVSAHSPPTSPTRSPPPKRTKMDAAITPPADTAPEAGPSSKVAQAVMDAPINAMFAPARTKAEIKKRKRMKHPIPEPYSTGEVLWLDVRSFLGEEWVDGVIAKEDEGEWEVPQELRDGREFTLRVGAFTVSGRSSLVSYVHVWLS